MKITILILGAALVSVDGQPPTWASAVELRGDGVVTWVRGSTAGRCFLTEAKVDNQASIYCNSAPGGLPSTTLIISDRLIVDGFEGSVEDLF